MIYIGIDPGLTGAIGVLDHRGRYLDLHDIPTREKANAKTSHVKEEIDDRETIQILKGVTDLGSVEAYAIIEAQQAFKGCNLATMSAIVEMYGALKMALTASGIPFDIVHPITWKHRSGLKGKPKGYSLNKAIRLYPDAPLHLEKDHNRAEALLLANYLFEQRRSKAA